MSHPSQRIRATASTDLEGVRIVLGIAGSIAAVKTVELARELIRHGAHVLPVMTPAATRIVHPDALEFATGERPIVSLSGQVEHVRELGAPGDADLLLVAPATANTISKMALGIDDTALTTFATVARGANKPIVVAPAMHAPMEEHPTVQQHIESLRLAGVDFVEPKREEGKAKLASTAHIVAACARATGPRSLINKRVLIVTGGSSEPLDPVRVITNRSSGQTGVALANEAHPLGADLTVVSTAGAQQWPPGTDYHVYTDVRMLIGTFHEHLAHLAPDIVLVPAALADYAPEASATKISSDNDAQTLHLRRLPKALPVIRDILPDAVIVGWKLQDTLEQAVEAAKGRVAQGHATAMVANATSTLGADDTTAALVTTTDTVPLSGSKRAVARQLFAELLKQTNQP